MRLDEVQWRGVSLHVAWEAPGATNALVSFSTDGAQFRTIAQTGDPFADVIPSAKHGVIRVFVTDGKRHNVIQYRI